MVEVSLEWGCNCCPGKQVMESGRERDEPWKSIMGGHQPRYLVVLGKCLILARVPRCILGTGIRPLRRQSMRPGGLLLAERTSDLDCYLEVLSTAYKVLGFDIADGLGPTETPENRPRLISSGNY